MVQEVLEIIQTQETIKDLHVVQEALEIIQIHP